MDVRFWFSIFLDDGHGSAFGAASGISFLNNAPVVEEHIDLTILFPPRNDQIHSPERKSVIAEYLRHVRIVSCSPEITGRADLSCELEDIVVSSRESADQILSFLSSVGFDCDVWSSH